jgi:tetratricopeptide (TPR) repeat protein
VLGYSFVLPIDVTPGPSGGLSWLRCRKCASLFQGGASLQGGLCARGGSHEGYPSHHALPHDTAEDALHQANWRLCQKCHGIFWNGNSPQQGVCPAHGNSHLPDPQVDFVLPHDYPEDPHHQGNWRRCLKCDGMFWDGFWEKGSRCPKGDNHDALAGEDIARFLQDEFILTHDVAEDANHQANWQFCTKCFGMFYAGNPQFKGCCPVDRAGHSVADNIVTSKDLPTGYIRLPVASRDNGYDFVLPHDVPGDQWHETGWSYCTKCAGLFRGLASDGGCPAGGGHASAGFSFVLPHRVLESAENDRDWRFCTKCFGLVSTKAPIANVPTPFWTVASVVVSNDDCPGLPQSPTGNTLVILGYGWADFYLACVPLGNGPIRLQDTHYFTGTEQNGHARWDPDVEKAVGLFGTASLADPNHISMEWLECPKSWILLYTRPPPPVPGHGSEEALVVARLGSTPWSWSSEIPIIAPDRAGELYGPKFSKSGTWPYGPYILRRFTQWNASTRELGIYYLISLSNGYQVHLMHTRLSLWETQFELLQALFTQAARLIEAGRLDEAVTAARETDQVARRAATASGADVNTIASLLLDLSSALDAAGRHSDAAEQAQAEADVLRGFEPTPAGQAAHLLLLEQALFTQAARLIEAGRIDEAVTAAHEMVAVARRAAAASGADVNTIASLLLDLSGQLAVAGRHPEAAEAAQAAADVLRGFAPPPAGQTAYLLHFVNALFVSVVRLIEAGRVDEAVTAAHEMVAVARRAAAASGADVNTIASLLLDLSGQLAGAGRPAEAAEVARAAADLR